ncbi:hypothetical protein H2248_002985 [Termitomyces sp. 'cryptogamus']|nr:hypothetical protein H2248_002985 [Termitomyces sp. 'cryptogamus']
MSLSQGAQNEGETTPLLRGDENDLFTSMAESTSTTKIFWEELRTLPRYVCPILGAQWLEHSMIGVNLISIGHLSTTALAAVSLSTMTANVTGVSVLQGLATGLDTILPAAFTSPQPQLVGLWTQRMAVVMICALVPVLIVWHKIETIFVALQQDREVSRLAALYLRWLSLGLPALIFNIISRRYFQSQRLLSVQPKIILYVAPINCLMNYLLVWGPQRIRLGFIGAPIATVASYYLISIVSLMYGRYLVPKTAWHPLSMKMFYDLGIITRLGLSGVAQVTSTWWAWECIALATSYLGPTALACQSILISSSGVTFQILSSIAAATTIRVGNLLGEKNVIRASAASRAGMVVALVSSGTTSLVLLLTRHTWPKLYSDDPAVVTLVSSVVPVIALQQFPTGLAQMGIGHMRVQGKQFVGALMNFSGYFFFGVPIGIWLAFQCDVGLSGLWIGLTIGLTFTGVGLIIPWMRTDWRKEVLEVAKRNSREEQRRKMVESTEDRL